MTRHDPVERPGLVTEALVHRGLVNPDQDEDERRSRDVLGGGRAAAAPRSDVERFDRDGELVGAGPDEEDDYVYGRTQDDGSAA
ncbi:hypothetical protein GCM10023169_00210 [Georgenia halophila]|uniref:DUF5709 domain-containing protein n=2 Tax=Georgenia halophila TaxID=620889 RepID=A0ABP8KSS2_9MICO